MEIARFSERLVRDAPDAIIYADEQGLIQFWNRSAERIFGFSEAQALGKTLDIIGTVNLFGRGQRDSRDWARCVAFIT